MENVNDEVVISDEQLLKELKKFNFGAFMFGWIWGLPNGVYMPSYVSLVVWIMTFLPVVAPFARLIQFIVCIVFGIKGNEWTYNDKEWQSYGQFKKAQKKWSIAALIILLPVLIIYGGGILSFFAAKGISNSDIYTKGAVMNIMMSEETKNASSGAEIVDYFIKTNHFKGKMTKGGADSLVNSSGDVKMVYIFYKNGTCKLDGKNCYVTGELYNKGRLYSKVRTYYDMSGKTKSVKVKVKK